MSALLYGLNAGLSFSPHTLGMVLKTIMSGRKDGLLFMLSGLTLDLILITTVLVVQDSFELDMTYQLLLHVLSGLMVIRMGLKAYKARLNLETPVKNISSWKEGFFLQMLNPNPYVFWVLIGVPYMISLKNSGLAFQFVLVFLAVTYGLKTLIVESCARVSGGDFLKSKNFMLVRKTVSVITIMNGLYIVITNVGLVFGTNYNFAVLN